MGFTWQDLQKPVKVKATVFFLPEDGDGETLQTLEWFAFFEREPVSVRKRVFEESTQKFRDLQALVKKYPEGLEPEKLAPEDMELYTSALESAEAIRERAEQQLVRWEFPIGAAENGVPAELMPVDDEHKAALIDHAEVRASIEQAYRDYLNPDRESVQKN